MKAISVPFDSIFLSRDPTEHHQLVLATGRPADPTLNVVNQISFPAPDIATLRRFHERLRVRGADDIQPLTHGNTVSIYCGDLEGNRLELFVDTPWYRDQPLRLAIDIAQSDAAILAQAELLARRRPGFHPRAKWQAEVARRMAEDQRG